MPFEQAFFVLSGVCGRASALIWPDRVTKRGLELAQSPGRLFAELIPFYLLRLDHSAYSGIDEPPFGKWDVWLNVINMEADHGSTERKLYSVFYGEEADWDNAGWREMAAFSSCVLKTIGMGRLHGAAAGRDYRW